MNKKQLCDWADELRFAEVFEKLDQIPNKPKISLYNDLKDRYIAGEANQQFVGQVRTYILSLDSPENQALSRPEPSSKEMGVAMYHLAEILQKDGEISAERAKEIFEARNRMYEKIDQEISQKINPQSQAEAFFERIVATQKLNATDTADIRNLLKVNTLPYPYQCVLVSALMLSLLRKYDKTRLDLLLDALSENVPHVWERALLALVLGLMGREERLRADTELVRRLETLRTQDRLQSAVVSINYAFYEVEIKKTLENDEFYSKTLPQFRSLGFFGKEEKPHYWFLPFYAENEEILAFFEENDLNLNHQHLINLLASPYPLFLSDSNKYALCFATNTGIINNAGLINIMEENIRQNQDDPEFDSYAQNHYFLKLLTDIWYFRNFYPKKEWTEVLKKQRILHESVLLDFLAIEQSKKLIQVKILFEKANILENLKQQIELYEQIIQLNSYDHHGWYNLGRVYNDSENYEKAIEYYEKAIEIKPDFYYSWNSLGVIYDELKYYQKAIECYEKAIEIKPNFHHSWYNLGITYLYLQNYEKVIECYQKAIEIKPDFRDAWHNLGNISYEQKNYAKAIECYQKAVEIKPDDNRSIYSLACLYSLQKDKEKALSYFQEAISLNTEWKKYATEDTDFEWLWEDEDFKKLVV